MTKTIEMIAPATLAVKIRDNKSEVKLVAKAVQVLPIKKIKISASKTRCRKNDCQMMLQAGCSTHRQVQKW